MHRDGEVIDHVKFQQLAALAATGQLSAAEYAELAAHFEVCPTCKEEYGDFEEILHGQLPLLHSELAPPAELSSGSRSDEFKERFFARAQAKGLPFAPALPPRQTWGARLRLIAPGPVFAYAAILVLAVLVGFSAYQGRRANLISQARLEEIQRLDKQNAALREELSDKEKAQDALTADELSAARSKNVELAVRYDTIEQKLKAASDEIEALRKQAQEQTQIGQEKESRLSRDLDVSRAAIGQMTVELDNLRKARNEGALALADRQARIEELQKQLTTQTESLDRTRRLLTADRDIRDLMGARNLHITDVYDVDGKGKTRQLFGRVFYTKEKSLIFYAFDLQNPQITPAKQSFQAWGYKESAKQVARSLGIFYLDDKNQNRWALKFDDPAVLAEIDAVFVTVEPPGGSSKPTGQKLLYAFLRSDANHP
ncbi:MAG: hypothetical protein HY234_14945 [Acidobacteria bacterium]|nr:hypothetical protein [Acidobacteriota bacterium]